MRRYALLGSILCLSACSGSGFWRYEQDTFTLPGANPNIPVGSAENFQRAHNGTMAQPVPAESGTMLTEAGDIWPGPPQPVPTLKDLQKQQTAEINGATSNASTGPSLAPLPPLPSLPGYEISQQEPGRAAPPLVYPNAVATHAGRQPIVGDQAYKAPQGSANGGNIVVPNGNGTSTVISPTGQVSTIPTPK